VFLEIGDTWLGNPPNVRHCMAESTYNGSGSVSKSFYVLMYVEFNAIEEFASFPQQACIQHKSAIARKHEPSTFI